MITLFKSIIFYIIFITCFPITYVFDVIVIIMISITFSTSVPDFKLTLKLKKETIYKV